MNGSSRRSKGWPTRCLVPGIGLWSLVAVGPVTAGEASPPPSGGQILLGAPRVPPPAASSGTGQGPAAPQPPPPEPWRKRVGVFAGGGGWRHTVEGVALEGAEARGGAILQWKRGPQRAGLELEVVNVFQSASDIQLTSDIPAVQGLGSGSGSGYREGVAGVVTGSVGYQWVNKKLYPYLLGKAGITAGRERTRIDLNVHTDNEYLPLGTLYGYDLAQAAVFQGIFFSPAVEVEVGIEPFAKGRTTVGLALIGSYWLTNKTFSLGVVLRFGHELEPKGRSL